MEKQGFSGHVNLENRFHIPYSTTKDHWNMQSILLSWLLYNQIWIQTYESTLSMLYNEQDALCQDFYLPPECCTGAMASCSRNAAILIPKTLLFA